MAIIHLNRVRLGSPPSPEMFKVEFEQYLPKESVIAKETEEEEEEIQDNTEDAVIASH